MLILQAKIPENNLPWNLILIACGVVSSINCAFIKKKKVCKVIKRCPIGLLSFNLDVLELVIDIISRYFGVILIGLIQS